MSQKTFKVSVLALLLLAALAVLYISTPANAHPVLGVTNFDSIWLRDTGPTAQPVLRVDQRGAGKIVEFMDGGTPVFSINNGGGIVASTILTQGATLDSLLVTLPTAATTATPAAIINSLAAGSNILSIRKNSTPVFIVGNTGLVTGFVEQSALSGSKCVLGTQTVTGTGTIAHGLATPSVVMLTLAEDLAADHGSVSYTNSAAVVTAKVWKIPVTPGAVAAATPVSVAYRICGTP